MSEIGKPVRRYKVVPTKQPITDPEPVAPERRQVPALPAPSEPAQVPETAP